MIYMFLSNNPSSGDINSLNLSCLRVLLYSTAKSELHVYHETTNLVKFVLMSLTELYLQQPVMESFYEVVLLSSSSC